MRAKILISFSAAQSDVSVQMNTNRGATAAHAHVFAELTGSSAMKSRQWLYCTKSVQLYRYTLTVEIERKKRTHTVPRVDAPNKPPSVTSQSHCGLSHSLNTSGIIKTIIHCTVANTATLSTAVGVSPLNTYYGTATAVC